MGFGLRTLKLKVQDLSPPSRRNRKTLLARAYSRTLTLLRNPKSCCKSLRESDFLATLTYTCVYIYMYVYVCVCVYVNVNVNVYVYVYVNVYVYVYVHVYVYIYIYIYVW